MEELSHAIWKGSFAARGKIRECGKRNADTARPETTAR